ncbi:serine/threonine-protein kinase [Streptomyces sp. NPDC058326]|uniref:serine/threonine-protein kinase n=1 Tax=Streptomyces sp. NPDC058326 TaxID=3346447 RepID=UPI0036E9B6DE
MQVVGPDDPTHVGPFRTVALLGQGGMGRVLLGAAADGRLVAVKRVHADLAEDEGFRARFRREVDASRRVSGAYTAPVVDADPDAAAPWLASLFLPGPTLSEALEAGGVLPEETVRRLAAGLARALADVHRAGLVHRDLKPSNVLLTEDGVRVIDFGIARAAEAATRITHTGALIGSPAFMAPEQMAGGDPGPAADIFALGATLAVACSGKPPFDGDSVPSVLHAVVHEEPDLTAVPPGLRGLIGACLAKDPALRPTPQAVTTFLGAVPGAARPWPEAVHARIAAQRAEVDRLLRSAPAAAPPPVPVPASPPGLAPRRRRGPVAAAVAAGVLVVAGAVGAATGWAADLYYMVVPEPVPTPGNVPLSEVADRYTGALPACADVFGQVRTPAGFAPRPTLDSPNRVTPYNDGQRFSQCTWITRAGDRIVTEWDQYDSAGGRTGAERAKERYEGFYRRGITPRDPSPGFVEEAAWEKPDGRYCVLRGRDVNLVVYIVVQGPSLPVGRCEAVVRDVGRQTMEAVKAR